MPDRLNHFIQAENIRNFKKQIEAETNPDRLATLKLLLETEQAKGPVIEKSP